MHTLCDLEAEGLCGGFGITLPNIQISPSILVNAVPQINAGTAVGVLGGSAEVGQGNGTFLWNNLTTLIGSRFRR
jgi:hypothetical protein